MHKSEGGVVRNHQEALMSFNIIRIELDQIIKKKRDFEKEKCGCTT